MPDPLSPDEIEQRQSAVPEDEDAATYEEGSDRPLTPDEIEQRHEVGWDDEDQPLE